MVTKEKLEGWLAAGADLTQELSNAVIANDLNRVSFLVGKGADVNKIDNQGATPLTAAARQRHDEMIKLLIELGADVNLPNQDGMTPLIDRGDARPRPRRSRCCLQWRRSRKAGPRRLPAVRGRHRRGQIRGGQGLDGRWCRCE